MTPTELASISGIGVLLVAVIGHFFASGKWTGATTAKMDSLSGKIDVQAGSITTLAASIEKLASANDQRHRDNEVRLGKVSEENARQAAQNEMILQRISELSGRVHDQSTRIGMSVASSELSKAVLDSIVQARQEQPGRGT